MAKKPSSFLQFLKSHSYRNSRMESKSQKFMSASESLKIKDENVEPPLQSNFIAQSLINSQNINSEKHTSNTDFDEITAKTSENNSNQAYHEHLNNSDNSNSEEKRIVNVLNQNFKNGFRLNSPLEIRRFRLNYEKLNGESLSSSDEEIEKTISSCGIVYENKLYLSKNMLSDSLKEKLLNYIDATFDTGITSIYFEALFQEFSNDFLDWRIYNADMLRAYLLYECANKYVIGKNQISRNANVIAEPIDEIRNCLKAYARPMRTTNLYATLSHLPQDKIYAILGGNLEFVRNEKGEYFHADMLTLSEEELDNISDLIDKTIKLHGYISGTELMNDIRKKYPQMYEGFSIYSDIGWRDALKYKIGDRFSFKGNIISSIGSTLSMSNVFGQLAASSDRITVDELLAFASDMGASSIYFDPVYQNALRIDENTFVSKNRSAFQVEDTDKILDRFCTGNYISLTDVSDFGIFPDAGFPWTVYLLESYVSFYSERYMLLHGGYNRNCAVGAIVKKSAGYRDFDELLVNVMADSTIKLNKQDVLNYLSDSGYISRRTYKNIEDLIILATSKRNRKGRL